MVDVPSIVGSGDAREEAEERGIPAGEERDAFVEDFRRDWAVRNALVAALAGLGVAFAGAPLDGKGLVRRRLGDATSPTDPAR